MPETATFLHRKLLGRVAVDSGRLVLADPGCLCGESPVITDELLAQTSAGPIAFPSGAPNAGIVVETEHGDGLFSIFVVYRDETPIRIEIDLTGELENRQDS